MVEFNKLSEGEKFAFSKDFLVKFRVIQKLRPELSSEKDVLMLVAKKFYAENLEQLEDCIKFIESKVKFNSLSNVNLEPAVKEYESGLKKKIEDRKLKIKKEEEDEEKKRREYEHETGLRNYFDREYKHEFSRSKRNDKLRDILKIVLIAVAVIAVLSAGGIVGLGNYILAFVSNLSSLQLITLGAVVYFGWKEGWAKSVKGKYDGWQKGRKDKRKKHMDSFKDKQDLHIKEQKRIAEERAKIHAERIADSKAQEKAVHELEAESVHIGRYSRMNNFDKALTLSEIEIKDQYERALRQYDSDDDKKNLSKWFEYYVGVLYYGAYKGILKDREDINKMVEESKHKFEQLSNPLNATPTFSQDKARAQNISGVNKSLEEMYQSI